MLFDADLALEHGFFVKVFMARSNTTGEIVALKKVRMDNEKEGFPITAIREIKILKSLDHKNVIKLKEIVTSKVRRASNPVAFFGCLPHASDQHKKMYVKQAHALNQNKGSIYMVFEYMDHDLTGLADRPGMKFSEPQIKCVFGFGLNLTLALTISPAQVLYETTPDRALLLPS